MFRCRYRGVVLRCPLAVRFLIRNHTPVSQQLRRVVGTTHYVGAICEQVPSLVSRILSTEVSVGVRGSWLRDVAVLEGKVAYRFVLGYDRSSALSQSAAAIACQKLSSAASAASPHDVVLVDAPDCHMWHSPAKVHAWFKYALHAFPLTHWLGKSEEDTMIWPSALLVDMSWLPPEVQYYGIMGWQGSCRSKHASARSAAAHDGKRGGEEIMARAVSDASQPLAAPPECTGCYGHPIAEGISLCRAATCRPGGAQTNGRRCCQVGCPKTVRMSPFAVGALDVRSRSLAAAVAKCAYADRYFECSRSSQKAAKRCAPRRTARRATPSQSVHWASWERRLS